ncbi:MAG: hydrogenobyrinic acid a,c-diamide synthase (glutamine-hydrolyzing), partial [Firmicutes bacterium]|nr:hydrogenobyrinic acid a,c-diamide synthase (glutamine-hydrolyzing) [Bacillota bacterium]
FLRHTAGSDLAVIEGAMGLFDGVDLAGTGSTAELAKVLDGPVVLVVDTSRMTRSVAAVVLGCQRFDPDLRIAGVILNRVARPRHEAMLRAAIREYCGLPVLGALPKDEDLAIPERHLGLIPAGERDELLPVLERLRRAAERFLDLDGLLELARSAPPLAQPATPREEPGGARGAAVTVGVLRDRAFSFYYPENLEALEAAGARLVFVDALADQDLPPVDALYIGGGFPEVFAAELQSGASLRRKIRAAVEGGLPVYAECGGLMYLCRRLYLGDRGYEMVGALPCDAVMERRPQGHGYTVIEVVGPNPFFPVGRVLRAHEFHHSRLVNMEAGRLSFAFRVHRGWGVDGGRDGLVYRNVLALYSHIHVLGCPEWAGALLDLARRAGGPRSAAKGN